MIYICEGTDKERLDWFRIINIAGEKLTDQELRNAVYTGQWLSDAKLKFSKSNCAAYLSACENGEHLVNGSPIRQDYLETAISWISDGQIEDYMAKHQHCSNADELWNYFQGVISWVRATFTNYRKEMKKVKWGELYKDFANKKLDVIELEAEVQSLMRDEDVTNKIGVYSFVLTREEKDLNIRKFTNNMKREAYERQNGICPICNEYFTLEQMEADHITPWVDGGKTNEENCQMLCKSDNRRKSSK